MAPESTAAPETTAEAAPITPVPDVDVLTLLVEAEPVPYPALVFVPGASAALSAVVASRRSPRLSSGAGHGRHVVRVVLAGTAREEEDAIAQATASVADMLGVAPSEVRIRGAHRSRRIASGARKRIGDAAQTDAVRAAVETAAGLHVTGAWVTGGELADLAADALAVAENVRRTLLWEPEKSPPTP